MMPGEVSDRHAENVRKLDSGAATTEDRILGELRRIGDMLLEIHKLLYDRIGPAHR